MLGNGASVNFANGSSYGASGGDAIGAGAIRWPVPTWRFGLRQSDDRGNV